MSARKVFSQALAEVVELLPNGFVMEVRFDERHPEVELRIASSKEGKRCVEARRWMLEEIEHRVGGPLTVANEMRACLGRLCRVVGVELGI